MTEAPTATAESVALARLPDPEVVATAFGLPEHSIQPNGLQIIDPEMSFDAWQSMGHTIGMFGRWSRFAIGDWYLAGEMVFGDDDASSVVEPTAADRYDVAHRVTGLAIPTLQNYVSLCNRVALDIRRIELDFSTHEPVAAMERPDQIYWLDQAVQNGWTKVELRDAIREATQPPDDTAAESSAADPARGLSRSERIEEAAALVYAQGQPTQEGGALVPAEAWSQLAAALGEE